jgi:magnesium-protoporphyrin O-methyltransferase
MDACCGPPDRARYGDVFDERFAQRVARRYRTKGPSAVERRLLEFVVGTGIDDATVLEIGGGIGELQLELLSRGAARTVNLELSHEYEAEAQRLITAAGVGGRVTRTVGVDLAQHPESAPRADIVVLNRVVCCYPESARLLAAAARRADRAIAFSHPPRNWITRAVVAVENGMYRAEGRSYRAYVHDPEALCDTVRRQGFEIVRRDPGPVWCVVGAVRAA